MRLSGNTILSTGGTSEIGLGLAQGRPDQVLAMRSGAR